MIELIHARMRTHTRSHIHLRPHHHHHTLTSQTHTHHHHTCPRAHTHTRRLFLPGHPLCSWLTVFAITRFLLLNPPMLCLLIMIIDTEIGTYDRCICQRWRPMAWLCNSEKKTVFVRKQTNTEAVAFPLYNYTRGDSPQNVAFYVIKCTLYILI